MGGDDGSVMHAAPCGGFYLRVDALRAFRAFEFVCRHSMADGRKYAKETKEGGATAGVLRLADPASGFSRPLINSVSYGNNGFYRKMVELIAK